MKNPLDQLLTKVNLESLPNHVAIIMDGNGRWAQEKRFGRIRGHRAGVQSIKKTVTLSRELGIKYLTLYAFSTENWKRPKPEVKALWNLLHEFLDKEIHELHSKGVKIHTIGQTKQIPEPAYSKLQWAMEKTKNNENLVLTLALNYGARKEITEAIRNIIKEGKGKDEVTEELLERYLQTKGIPDPDLLIRTSGEMRISNFLLWQISYSELFFSPVLWPNFNEEELLKAIIEYQTRKRRFGGL